MASNDDDLYIMDENEVWQVVKHQDEDSISKKDQLTRKARKPVLATKPKYEDPTEPLEVMNLRETGTVRKPAKITLSLSFTSSSEDEILNILKNNKKPRMTKYMVTRSKKTYKRQLNSSTSDSENEDPVALRSRKRSYEITTNEEENVKKEALPTDEKPKAKKKPIQTIAKKKAVKTKAKKEAAITTDQKAIPTKKPVIADEQLGAVGGVERKLDTSIVTTIPVLDRTTTDIECNCCYNEVPFDYMVQCSEGHLFCCHCLENYAKEAVYGHGKGELKCMKGDCEFTFPISQICRALPENLYAKYEERMASECLNVVNLENFVKCKFCNNGAILDPEEMYFACTQCRKHFCRHCEELYQDHKGLTCDQVEKDEETKLRIQYEEKMAEAKIRSCLSCKSRFTKESGCNKMTCRCGKTMCYVCREPDINYKHFCMHLRDPDIKGCARCKSCFLWSQAEDDDRLAIEEIKKEAKVARQKEGFVIDCQIGATSPKIAADLQKLRINNQNELANAMPQQIPYQPPENDARNYGIEPQRLYQPQNAALNNYMVPQIPYQPQNAALNNIVPQQPYHRHNGPLNNVNVPDNNALNNVMEPQVLPRGIVEHVPRQLGVANPVAQFPAPTIQPNLRRENQAARLLNPRHIAVRNPLNRWRY